MCLDLNIWTFLVIFNRQCFASAQCIKAIFLLITPKHIFTFPSFSLKKQQLLQLGTTMEFKRKKAYFFSKVFLWTGYSTPNVVIIHLPACHSNSIKALFVFGTQFKIFLIKTRRLVTVSIDCQVNNTVEVQKRIKSIVRIVHLPSVVQSEFYDVTRIVFVRKENKNNAFFF